mgnify:CR=1 FL=1
MAAMAKWGGIAFSVNSNKALTFSNMKRSYSARWESHDIIGKRPKMEFKGADMDEITITVILDARLGIKPRATMKKFREAAKKGKVSHFYVGGRKVAKYKFYIASGEENWKEIWNKGELISATADITFKEYR